MNLHSCYPLSIHINISYLTFYLLKFQSFSINSFFILITFLFNPWFFNIYNAHFIFLYIKVPLTLVHNFYIDMITQQYQLIFFHFYSYFMFQILRLGFILILYNTSTQLTSTTFQLHHYSLNLTHV